MKKIIKYERLVYSISTPLLNWAQRYWEWIIHWCLFYNSLSIIQKQGTLVLGFFKDFSYPSLERGGGSERDISVWLPLEHPLLGTWMATQACLIAIPDWESNRRPFGLQSGTQSTEPHQPGPHWSLGRCWYVCLCLCWWVCLHICTCRPLL